jgi:hypothetical protein
MSKAIFISIAVAMTNAATCLLLIPQTNSAFQLWFDMGVRRTMADKIEHIAALIAAFPIATWTMALHPARVSNEALIVSIIGNSFLWAACTYFALRRRKALP